LDLDPDTDSTPHPHPSNDLYFESRADNARVLEEDDTESPAESTPSPREDDSRGIYVYTLEAGTVINGEVNEGRSISLSLIRALGRGAFSSVWLAQNNTEAPSDVEAGAYSRDGDAYNHDPSHGRLVAVKIAPRNNHITTLTFEREAEVLRVSDNLTGVSHIWHFMFVVAPFLFLFLNT
jgi:hypothetical protein